MSSSAPSSTITPSESVSQTGKRTRGRRARQNKPAAEERTPSSASTVPPSAAPANPPAAALPPVARVPPPPAVAPAPTRVSKTSSAPMNDPMVSESFTVQGFKSKATEIRPTFLDDFSGYVDLIDQTYRECARDNSFRSSVPYSLYQYYHIQLLHFRLNELEKLSQRAHDIQHDIRFALGHYEVHEVISMYLRGIGEFTSPDGEHYRLAPRQRELNDNGHFGHFNQATLPDYHAVPTPRVALDLVRADLAVPHVAAWIPRPQVGPDAPGNFVVTSRLLGYRISVPPAPRDRPVYLNLGLGPDFDPPDTINRWLFSPRLCDHVNLHIRELKNVKHVELKPGVLLGSILQLPFHSADTPIDNGNQQTATQNDLIQASRYAFDEKFASSAFVACYRFRRVEDADNANTQLAWILVNAALQEQPPPPAWLPAMNFRFNVGNQDRINVNYFEVSGTPRNMVLMDVMKAFNQ